MTRIAITGARGAMGRTVRERATAREDATVGLLVSRSGTVGNTDVPVVNPSAMPSALAEHDIDVLVDFTVPEASVEAVSAAAEAGTAAVVGTTGFTESQRADLQSASSAVPVLVAPNFSRGIQALLATVQAAVDRLPGYDVEITETHHNRKRDAPSGTANRLLEAIEARRPIGDRTFGRVGEGTRAADEIGVHARRAGTIAGEHEVLLAANDEVVRLTHRAESRGVFATGALDAAVWLADRSPGWYGFDEVVEA